MRNIAIPFFFFFIFPIIIFNGAFSVESPVAAKITKAIKNYLVTKDPALSGKMIEISYKYADKTFKTLQYRKGNVTFAVAELYPDYKPIGNIIVPIQVIVDNEPKEKIFIRTKVSVFDRIVVAKKRFKRGDQIDGMSVTLEVRDIASLSSGIIKDIDTVIGKETKTFIIYDNPIYDWMVKEKPLVRKNSKVKIMANSGNISVITEGLSSEDGSLGQEIKVKNLDSGKELVCVVTATDEVKVK